jgi:hypothetical protein
MPRVYHVILTKEFDVTILADSIEEVEVVLDDCQYEIDHDWDPPDWQIHVADPLAHITKSVNLPKAVSKFDMAIINGNLLSADEIGFNKQKINEFAEKAEEELSKLRFKLGMEETQVKLPF